MNREDKEKLKYIKKQRPSHEAFNMLVDMLAAKQKTVKELLTTADELIVKPFSIN